MPDPSLDELPLPFTVHGAREWNAYEVGMNEKDEVFILCARLGDDVRSKKVFQYLASVAHPGASMDDPKLSELAHDGARKILEDVATKKLPDPVD